MNASSLFLTTSSRQGRDALGTSPRTTSPLLVDVVPFEASLQRLLYEKVSSDEQMCSYSLQQAYRGVLYGVHAATLELTGVRTSRTNHEIASASQGGATHLGAASAETSTDACVLRGWQVALYRMALVATRSSTDLDCVIFLSTRILCDRATVHGQGNERPCCTQEWTHALLQGLPLRGAAKWNGERSVLDDRFACLVQANRRYQLGFLLLLSNTLRMLATGTVEGQRLCAEHTELFRGIAQDMVPAVAHYVEESLRDSTVHTAKRADADGAAARPNRLAVELNNLVLHCLHWLTTDVLLTHMDAETDSSCDAQGIALKPKRQRKRPLVIDRDQPACLWGCITFVRNALRRGVRWLAEELDHPRTGGVATSATALVSAVSQQLEHFFTDMVKRQELLESSLLRARREFNGAASNDTRALTEMMWANTLQMSFLVRNLTGVWVAVHGGLGLAKASADLVLPAYRDVLMYMASTLLRVPALDSVNETERTVFMATDATLSACLALVAAAPTTALQAELWAADCGVTQQIHALLVQRALRYRNERVLRLASLLSRAVLDAAVHGGALADFAADSSDQLLEFLESEDDAASRCAGELLCVSILEHPYRLIPALFRMLQHGSAVTRRHVLELLYNVPDLVSEQRAAGRGTQEGHPSRSGAPDVAAPLGDSHANPLGERRRNVLRLLAENLLLSLQDEELCVRLLSSSLFARVHPEDVLLPLLNLCVQRDATGRKQSAALSALTSVVTAHTDTAEIFLLLVQTGYRCHAAAISSLSTVTVTSRGATEASDGGGSSQCRTEVRRPTPQTPGDILSQALLYSADGVAGELQDFSSAPASVPARADENGVIAEPHSGNRHRSESHLQRALLTLTDRWVRAAAPGWTYADHSLPVLQFIARQANPSAGDGAANHFNDSATSTERMEEWAIKYTFRLTATLTGLTDVGLSEVGLRRLRTVHLQAIWDTFFARAPALEGPASGVWARIACTTEGVHSEGAGASASLHAVLLPLLCLRSCALSTFASADAALAKDAVDAPEESADDDLGNVLRRLWRVLWHGVTSKAKLGATLLAAYPEIQRVALEVLCRFPAVLFLSAWTQWVSEKANDARAATAAAEPDSELSVEKLFPYRVYLFGVSSYLAAASVQVASGQSCSSESLSAAGTAQCGGGFISDLRVVLEYCATLERLLSATLPRWLIEEGVNPFADLASVQQGGPVETAGATLNHVTATQDSGEKAELMRRRLCVAAVDAAAVIGVVALTYPSGFLAPVSLQTSDDGVASTLQTLRNSLLEAPLAGLASAYRDSARREKSTELRRQDDVDSETDWTLLLARFQLCLRIHECMLRAIPLHQVDAKGLLLCWFRCYLRPLVEVSNAACGSLVGRGHECRAAVEACHVLFQAVLLAHKIGGANASDLTDSGEGKSSTAPSLLSRLAWEEREALVSFAVGCVRFTVSPAVQTVGVRLFSAALVSAPDLFVHSEAMGAPSPSSAPPINLGTLGSFGSTFSDLQGPLSCASTALQSIALMHADRTTRVLADEVLRMLQKAATASSTLT
ncbi:hypothetical protein LSCM1_02237 [Leishmania martiniquensis]|uniref:Uncharacterized protein n=1 Tax=Leishmania martiniquensis TaxID=1580590 RepID=A0A836K9H4_9TRYP|nr:hypothetical protein LSCM1_02237 [Leishmania martiniquensis]